MINANGGGLEGVQFIPRLSQFRSPLKNYCNKLHENFQLFSTTVCETLFLTEKFAGKTNAIGDEKKFRCSHYPAKNNHSLRDKTYSNTSVRTKLFGSCNVLDVGKNVSSTFVARVFSTLNRAKVKIETVNEKVFGALGNITQMPKICFRDEVVSQVVCRGLSSRLVSMPAKRRSETGCVCPEIVT